MKISELVERLGAMKEAHGDCDVQIVHSRYHPGGNRGLSDTGGGYSREWLGTVMRITLSEYPNQIEIITTR